MKDLCTAAGAGDRDCFPLGAHWRRAGRQQLTMHHSPPAGGAHVPPVLRRRCPRLLPAAGKISRTQKALPLWLLLAKISAPLSLRHFFNLWRYCSCIALACNDPPLLEEVHLKNIRGSASAAKPSPSPMRLSVTCSSNAHELPRQLLYAHPQSAAIAWLAGQLQVLGLCCHGFHLHHDHACWDRHRHRSPEHLQCQLCDRPGCVWRLRLSLHW